MIDTFDEYGSLVEFIEQSTADVRERFNKMLNALNIDTHDYDGVYLVADECGEPGYDSGEFFVTGNWNPKRFPRHSEPPLTFAESMFSQLFDTFESWGIELGWCDEWEQCSQCEKAYRTSGDSYSWQPSMAFIAAESVCNECIRNNHEFFSFVIREAINNPNFAFTYLDATDMVNAGFTQWEPDNEQTYYSGWFEHMTDDPKKILNFILEALPEAEVVFLLDEASQFYSKFSAWFRNPESDDDNDNG